MKKRFILNLISILLVTVMAVVLLVIAVDAAPTSYDLWVGGERVTSNNLSGDGWKYEPGTNTLVLNGFGIATLGYNVEKNPSGYGDGKTWRYANIYAKGIDLTIRTEGKVSYIGDMNFGSNVYEVKSDGTHAVYSGIYNSGGKITITGSVKLCVGSNNRAIYAGNSGEIIFDNAREVELVTYGGDTLHAGNITLKGNSSVSATAGHAGDGALNVNVYATNTIKVYDSSCLKSSYELSADSDNDFAGIKCISNKSGTGIYVYGGEIRSEIYPVTYDIGSHTLYAIDAPSVNIEGDGVVDAKINNWHDTSKYYVNSVVYGSSIGKGKVNFNGSGIIRLQMWLKKPDGSSKIQQISPDSVSFAENVLHQKNTISDCHEEITAYICDGIFLSTKGVFQYWSYSEKNLYPTNYGRYYGFGDLKNDVLNLKDIVTKTPSIPKLVAMENCTNIVNPGVSDGLEIPEIIVKSGATLILKFDGDKDYTLTKPIYLEGGTLEIDGDYGPGIIKGLDVHGNGTVIFRRGTVAGNVEKTVKTVMYNDKGWSGNIDIPDYGNAVDENGDTVHKFAYKAETEYDYFSRVCIIRELEERTFLRVEGTFHKAENGDKMFYLWTDRADRPHRIDAYKDAKSYENSQPLSLKYGTNTFAPGTPFTLKENGVFAARAGNNAALTPLAGGNPTDLQKSFVSWVKWYVSKDGGETFELVQKTQGPTWDNRPDPKTIRFEYVLPEITEEQNGYIYRCEVCYYDVIEWERTLYCYDVTLYMDTMQLNEPDRYIDGQPARLEMTHGTTLDGVTFGYRWELSRTGGIRWETVQEGASAVYETAAVTDAMEGWQIRVVYSIYAGGKKISEGTTDPVTIDTIGKMPVITKHPENVRLSQTEKFPDQFPPDPNEIPIMILGPYYSFSIEAEGENLHYQWQRSKDNGRTFEDLPDENEARTKAWYMVEPGKAWQYRCIVYNDFGSVISNVAIPRVLYAPTVSNPEDLTVPEHTDAVFRVSFSQGLPYGTDVIWQVSKDGKTMVDVTAEDGTVNVYSEVINGEIHWYTTLTVSNVSQDMSGYMYRCIVKTQPNDEDYNALRRSWHATLTVTYNCAVDGHVYGDGVVTENPTCTEPGVRTYTCSVCDSTKTERIEPDGHDYKEATCTERATCKICNAEYGDFAPHTYTTEWSSSSYSHWHECSLCGNRTDEGAHNDADSDHNCDACGKVLSKCADNNNDHNCDICGAILSICADDDKNHNCDLCGKKLTDHTYRTEWSKDRDTHWHECSFCGDKSDEEAHIYDSGVVTKKPTCTESGVRIYTCVICNETKTDEIQAKGHQYENATCIKRATCKVCKAEYGDFAPHTYMTEWSIGIDSHWHECSLCGNITDEEAHNDADSDHDCDACGKTLSKCADNNNDHNCDICGAILSNCADNDRDHHCDICTRRLTDHTYMTEWSISNYSHWHECSFCGNRTDEEAHNDANSDHKCDICEKRITKCTDTNKNHKCDICGKTVTICVDVNKDHKCDICQKTLTGCVDKNKDHLCDICIKKLTDHKGGKATCVEKAICTICGKEYGSLAGHTYKEEWIKDKDNHWHECSVCGIKKDKSAHVPGAAATETTPEVCTTCNYEITPALGHTHSFTLKNTDVQYLISDATCTARAVYCYSCFCGASGSAVFEYGDFADHSYKNEWTDDEVHHWHECSACGARKDETAHIDADRDHDCDICGKTLSVCADSNKDHKCDVCGETLSQCTDSDKDHNCDLCGKKLTDHTGGKATCKDKAICTICNLQYGDLADHDYKTEWSSDSTNHWHECPICGARKDETAHTPGAEATETTPQVCTVCDYVIKDALGHIHNFNQQKTTEEYLQSPATCTTKAVYCFSCACGEKGVETFGYGEMLAHTWKTEWVVDEAEHRHECSVCGAKGDGAGHAFERKIDKEASVTEIGAMHEECTVCGYQKVSVAIDKLAPAIIEGMNGKWNKGDENGLVFKSNAAYADFVEVLVDGKVIPSDSYYIREGSIVVELKSSYLAELAEGKHTFAIRSVSGDVSTEFTVEAKIVSTSNGTASALIWIIVGIIALGGVVTAVIFIIRKRKKA